MNIKGTNELTKKQKEAILEIWNEEYPEQLKYTSLAEFEKYLEGLQDMHHYLLTNGSDEISGWAFAFARNGERWFGIILKSIVHGQGYGTRLLDELKKDNSELNGWVTDHNNGTKKDGTIYLSPIGFYIKNGFTVIPDVRIETEKLSAVKITWHRYPS